MKKSKKEVFVLCFLAILFLIALSSQMVFAYFFDVSHNCQEDNCIEGQEINWTFSFQNAGNNELKIVSVEIFNPINQSVISGVYFDYDVADSSKNDYFSVIPGTKKNLIISDYVPKQNSVNKLVYAPCITTILDPTVAKYLDDRYYETKCYENKTIDIFECVYNRHCKDNEVCTLRKCVKIECEDCQYILNKECVDYDCCSTEDCGKGESCISHKCTKLNCSYDEMVVNNTCVKLDCSYDEYAFEHECIKLECEDDEGMFNHTCIKLECEDDEHIFEHECIKLDCSYDEKPFNHTCIKLECEEWESPLNHECVEIECGFLKKRQDNGCILDTDFILKLLLEIAIVIIIIILFLIDIKMRREKRIKRLF
ncbi:MAG: hypothetical protein PHV16_01550 [Candidatus Nanoarchaeia archaeon]|nr:hypothetical protein [Candidatus Nanoarchaeia archaeon]